MKLISHKHSGVRGLKDEKHEFSMLNNVVGNNGDGKTSLLESIYVSLLGTPFSSLKRAGNEISRNKQGNFEAVSTLDNGLHKSICLSYKLINNKKKHEVNGDPTTMREAFLNTPVCLIGSDIERVASESPDYRRRLLDRAVFHVEHKHVESYKRLSKALKQRNKAIKQDQEEKTIRSWDNIIAREGETVTEARRKTLQHIQEEMEKSTGAIATKRIKLIFKKGWRDESLQNYLERNIKRDIAAKRTMGGPQRDDFMVSVDGVESKGYSSRGEEKQSSLAFAFAIPKIIYEKTGASPIILIDELESGLDRGAVERVIKYIKSLKNQIFITSLEHHIITETFKSKSIHPKQHNL